MVKALLLYAALPFHRGKQRLMEHAVALLGVSLPGERVVRRRGLWWALDPADYVCRDLFWAGAKDNAQMRAILEAMRPGGVMLDVGASFGYYSLVTAHALGEACTIHAFEPNPTAFARLTGNIERNRMRCIEAHPVGLWDHETGMSVVDDLPGNSGAAHLVPGGPVPTTTADAFCAGRALTRVDVMKIDAEGAELRVLRGAARVLDTLRPVLLVELNADALARNGASTADVLDLLEAHRYDVRPVKKRDRRLDLRNPGAAIVDVLCTPRR